MDPYPEIKKSSCACASLLAKSLPQQFHTQSESLITPLLMTVSHQHSKVRIAAVTAIGMCLLLLGSLKKIGKVLLASTRLLPITFIQVSNCI